jgi:DME family drug/metabolite transporter
MIGIVYALVQRRVAIQPVTIILIRAASGFALLGGFALLARRDLLRVRARDLPFLALFGVVTITGFYVALIYAYQLVGVPLATVMLYLGPAFVTAASALVLGEPLTRRKGLALGLCLLGAALVVEPWRPEAMRANWLGLLLGLLSAIGYGLYSILGKLALRRVPPLTMVLYVLGFGTLGMVPVQLMAGSPLPGGLTLLALGLLMGIVITLLPLGLYTAGLNELPAGVASIMATFEPVVAVALSALILGQVLRLPQLAGAALIIGGVVVLAGGERARRETEAAVAAPVEVT